MLRSITFTTFTTLILLLVILLASCDGIGDPTTPSDEDPDMRIEITRLNPANTVVEGLFITITRTQNQTVELPGRNIEIAASSGEVSLVTDRGDGVYEAVWTGAPVGEVTLTASDLDSDPVVSANITFLALEFLLSNWDVPIRLKDPISTDGWEAYPFIYPDGEKIAFSYITLDMASLAGDVTRPIGEERPDQSIPQTMDLYIADRPNGDVWWAGWEVENAPVNYFQALPMHIAAPMITSDGFAAFCTVQELDGVNYTPTKIYSIDPDFSGTPIAVGAPLDMTGLGEDNPYFDATNGWMYFDTYDLGDPLSKQNIWAAQSIGGGQFMEPEPMIDLNTGNIETQPFMQEQSGWLYFASDRQAEEFILGIWRAPVSGSFSSPPEIVARSEMALGKPTITLDNEWMCFVYAKIDGSGANTDIAMCKRIEQ